MRWVIAAIAVCACAVIEAADSEPPKPAEADLLLVQRADVPVQVIVSNDTDQPMETPPFRVIGPDGEDRRPRFAHEARTIAPGESGVVSTRLDFFFDVGGGRYEVWHGERRVAWVEVLPGAEMHWTKPVNRSRFPKPRPRSPKASVRPRMIRPIEQVIPPIGPVVLPEATQVLRVDPGAVIEFPLSNTSDQPVTFGLGQHGQIVGATCFLMQDGQTLPIEATAFFVIDPLTPQVVAPGESVMTQVGLWQYPGASGRCELWAEYQMEDNNGQVTRNGLTPHKIERYLVAILYIHRHLEPVSD